jgi:hypothetical protein
MKTSMRTQRLGKMVNVRGSFGGAAQEGPMHEKSRQAAAAVVSLS